MVRNGKLFQINFKFAKFYVNMPYVKSAHSIKLAQN